MFAKGPQTFPNRDGFLRGGKWLNTYGISCFLLYLFLCHSKLPLQLRRERLVLRRVSGGRLGGRISKGIGDGVLMAHAMTAGPRSGAGGLVVYWLPHKPAQLKK